MPKVVNEQSGELIATTNYDAAGHDEANLIAQNTPGSIVVHSNDFDSQEYTKDAAAEQQQMGQDVQTERMDAMMNPQSPFGSSKGLGQAPGMGGGFE